MRKLLNTLFVMTDGAYLHKEGEAVVIRVDGELKHRIPIHGIGAIVCFGNVSCSQYLMGFCAENGVEVVFLSINGRFLARVLGKIQGNVLLRRQQFRYADNENFKVEVSRAFVAGKIANSRKVLHRALRDHAEKIDADRINDALDRLKYYLGMLEFADNMDIVRGIEGSSANVYFEVFDNLIVAQKDKFTFTGRNRRPPRDRVNALLSFLYTLLRIDAVSALSAVGLDPYVGFLHADRPGRESLALDLMEEFRPFLADRIALSLINTRQISPRDFDVKEAGAVWLNDSGRKKVIKAYQERKREKIHHPFVDETVEIGLLVHIQARLLAKFIRGELDAYPPFVWR